MKSVQRNG